MVPTHSARWSVRRRVAAAFNRARQVWVATDPHPEYSRLDRLDGLR